MRRFVLVSGVCSALAVATWVAESPRAPAPQASTPQEDASPLRGTSARDAEAKEKAARNALLARIDEARDIDSRLDVLLAATLGSSRTIPDPIEAGPIMEYFTRLPAVQNDLRALSESDRAEVLADLRRRLGFSEEQVARLHLRDARQAARWEIGRVYMRARAELEAELSGEELETALSGLRRVHFGDRAETIRREEDAGFFRFERPQILGRN